MAKKLFPDATRLGVATRPPTPANANKFQKEVVTATAGTRTLTYEGQTTSALAFDADAATIQTALEALSNVGVGDIVVVSLEAANEVQTVTLGAGNSGGNFDLAFAGQSALAIAFDATGADVQTALEALSNIAVGDVAVTGAAGGPYVITFKGVYAGTNVPKITGTGHLTGGTNTVTITTAAEASYTNEYHFTGAFIGKDISMIVVNGASLTPANSSVITSYFAEIQAREATKAALAARGFSRPADLAANDIEKLSQRKPKDIGDPDRIPVKDNRKETTTETHKKYNLLSFLSSFFKEKEIEDKVFISREYNHYYLFRIESSNAFKHATN